MKVVRKNIQLGLFIVVDLDTRLIASTRVDTSSEPYFLRGVINIAYFPG
jgi:hypothetical protein